MIELLGVGLIGFFLLVVQKLIYDRLWMRRLTVSVSFDTDHIFEGEESEQIGRASCRERVFYSV